MTAGRKSCRFLFVLNNQLFVSFLTGRIGERKYTLGINIALMRREATMKNLKTLTAALIALGLSGHATAGIVVDGNIDEWLSNKTTWAPANAGIHAAIDDQTGGLNTYLSPGYGGQAYDAEALYATIHGDRLFIALATGHNPLLATSGNNYGAGDFAIDFGKNGSYELGINFRNPNGVSTADKFGVNGGVYRVSECYYGLWQAPGVQTSNKPVLNNPTSIKAGDKIADADFAYSTAKTGYGSHLGDTHYFYEMSVDIGMLTRNGWDGSAFNIHWTENCANDTILVDPDRYVPEPGSMALFGAAIFSLLGMRRRAKAG